MFLQSEKRVIAATADLIIKTNVLLCTFNNVNSKVKLDIFKARLRSYHLLFPEPGRTGLCYSLLSPLLKSMLCRSLGLQHVLR